MLRGLFFAALVAVAAADASLSRRVLADFPTKTFPYCKCKTYAAEAGPYLLSTATTRTSGEYTVFRMTVSHVGPWQRPEGSDVPDVVPECYAELEDYIHKLILDTHADCKNTWRNGGYVAINGVRRGSAVFWDDVDSAAGLADLRITNFGLNKDTVDGSTVEIFVKGSGKCTTVAGFFKLGQKGEPVHAFTSRENACCPKGCNPVYDECIPDVKRSPPPSPPPSPIDTPSAQYAHPSCFPAFQNIPGSDKPKLTGVEGIPFNVEGGLRRVSTNRYCFTVAAKGDCENELSGSRGCCSMGVTKVELEYNPDCFKAVREVSTGAFSRGTLRDPWAKTNFDVLKFTELDVANGEDVEICFSVDTKVCTLTQLFQGSFKYSIWDTDHDGKNCCGASIVNRLP